MNKRLLFLLLVLLGMNGVLFWQNLKDDNGQTACSSTCRVSKKAAIITTTPAVLLPGSILNIN
jgi:hypothetical protein